MRVLLLLSILVMFSAGCITKRGTKVDAESITPSDLIRLPNGIYKLKPKEKTKIPDGIPYDPPPLNIEVKSLPVPPKHIVRRPEPVKVDSAKAKEILPTIRPSGEITPFSPTVTIPVLPTIKETSSIKVNVIPITNENQATLNGQANEANIKVEEEEKMQVKWPELMLFYLCAAAVILIGYMCYKITQGIRGNKKVITGRKMATKKRSAKKRLKKNKKKV